MKSKLIEFIPARLDYEGVFDHPVAAKTLLPEWYKEQSMYTEGQRGIGNDGTYNHTVKACMPALDAMSAGYIIPLPQDVEVMEDENGNTSVRWPSSILEQVASHSLAQIDKMPLNTAQWDQVAWKWINPWRIKTPPGYSCLFIQPMWHEDLPFRCFSGVVDTDAYHIQPVNFPFVFEKGFRGSLAAGTPMIQVIPFERNPWESKVSKYKEPKKKWERSKRHFGHRYKKDYRQPKDYR